MNIRRYKFTNTCYVIGLLLIMFVVSCQKDDPTTPDTTQPTVSYKSMEGKWVCQETGTIDIKPINYTVNITVDESKSPVEIYIANFYHYGFDYKGKATITTNTVTIPSQVLCNSSINGSGYISENNTKMNLIYYVTDSSEKDTVKAVFTKQ